MWGSVIQLVKGLKSEGRGFWIYMYILSYWAICMKNPNILSQSVSKAFMNGK